MYRFYVNEEQRNENEIIIIGPDVNHIKNVLRMKVEDEIIICDGQGSDFYCIISEITGGEVKAAVLSSQKTDTELDTEIYLFQGLPKKDKMELIIQKAVELGVHKIIPVMTRRTVVKLEDKKKEQKKLERWQSIAAGAAKQSGRGMIPQITSVMNYKEALTFAQTLDYNLIPYEKEKNIDKTKKIVKNVSGKNSIGIFIGPEGGFEEDEIISAMEAGIMPITLGRRILRTETAGFTVLSILMFELERQA